MLRQLRAVCFCVILSGFAWAPFSKAIETSTATVPPVLAYLYWGGGEEGKPENQFYWGLKACLPALKSADVEIRELQVSSHPAMIDISRQNGIDPTLFSRAHFTESLKNLALNPPSGRDILIFWDTHGAKPEIGENGETKPGHLIYTEGGTFHTSNLERLVQMLEAKGNRVLVIDASCYSGSTVEIFSPKPHQTEQTCVISATGKNVVGYTTFTQNFCRVLGECVQSSFGDRGFRTARRRCSAEEIFLKTRAELVQGSLPSISTLLGRKLARFVRVLDSNDFFDPEFRLVLGRDKDFFFDENAGRLRKEAMDYLTQQKTFLIQYLQETERELFSGAAGAFFPIDHSTYIYSRDQFYYQMNRLLSAIIQINKVLLAKEELYIKKAGGFRISSLQLETTEEDFKNALNNYHGIMFKAVEAERRFYYSAYEWIQKKDAFSGSGFSKDQTCRTFNF